MLVNKKCLARSLKLQVKLIIVYSIVDTYMVILAFFVCLFSWWLILKHVAKTNSKPNTYDIYHDIFGLKQNITVMLFLTRTQKDFILHSTKMAPVVNWLSLPSSTASKMPFFKKCCASDITQSVTCFMGYNWSALLYNRCVHMKNWDSSIVWLLLTCLWSAFLFNCVQSIFPTDTICFSLFVYAVFLFQGTK